MVDRSEVELVSDTDLYRWWQWAARALEEQPYWSETRLAAGRIIRLVAALADTRGLTLDYDDEEPA